MEEGRPQEGKEQDTELFHSTELRLVADAGAEVRGARAGIALDLCLCRVGRFIRERGKRRYQSAVAGILDAGAVDVSGAEEVLHRPVFERVVGDDGEASPGAEERFAGFEETAERAHLVIDGDAERLEDAGEALLVVWRDDRLKRLYERIDRGEPADVGGFFEQKAHPPCAPCFAIVADDLPELVGGGVADQFERGASAALVHPHVYRRVEAEGEAALRLVQVVAGDAEIGEDAVDLVDAEVGHKAGDVAEVAPDEGESRILSQRIVRLGVEVSVYAEEMSLVAESLEDRPRVPPAAEGGVDIDPVGIGDQLRHRLLEEHGRVVVLFGHLGIRQLRERERAKPFIPFLVSRE